MVEGRLGSVEPGGGVCVGWPPAAPRLMGDYGLGRVPMRCRPDEGSGDRAKAARIARIVIADDYEPVRRQLRLAFQGAGWQVCGEAANGEEAIRKAVELKPDVLVLDIGMPVMGGIQAAPLILQQAPGTKIIVFTMHESQQIRNEMLSLGVHGLAVKSAPLGELLDAIRSVLNA